MLSFSHTLSRLIHQHIQFCHCRVLRISPDSHTIYLYICMMQRVRLLVFFCICPDICQDPHPHRQDTADGRHTPEQDEDRCLRRCRGNIQDWSRRHSQDLGWSKMPDNCEDQRMLDLAETTKEFCWCRLTWTDLEIPDRTLSRENQWSSEDGPCRWGWLRISGLTYLSTSRTRTRHPTFELPECTTVQYTAGLFQCISFHTTLHH